MQSTAKKCVQWAVALVVVGTLLVAYGTDLYIGLAEVAGANAQAGLGVVDVLLTLVRSIAFPLGAVLVGAAIVIQTLAPSGASLAPEPAPPLTPER